MIKITLPDGSVRECEKGTKIYDIASGISEGLARNALCAGLNGKLTGLDTPVEEDAELRIYTFKDEAGREVYRHTTSHILAQAVKNIYPTVKLAIGPAIKDGFYYDFEFKTPITQEDFPKIEAEMQRIIKANLPLVRKELSRQEAEALFRKFAEDYKIELLSAIPEGETVSTYTQGEFTDLCRGPHLSSTGKVKAFKLTSVAGAYWRGDSKNKMLTRIYGTCFDKKADLEAYITRMEEAKKRDHRKLGKELDLYDILPEGPGFPFFYPKGMVLRNILENFWREEHIKAGYVEIKTPMILNRDLWYRSGHWDHYKDNMYGVKIDDEDYAIKPMNCPGGMLVYKRSLHSYRDLPIRMGELGLVHRHELSGALHGLMRVRCFTQDDAHIFMMPEQIESEIIGVVKLIDRFYKVFGFKYSVELSTRPQDFMGSIEQWDKATEALKSALNKLKQPFTVNEGDGAFYGPKIDFHLEDCIGRTWQCGTIQLDFQMPERFDLTYTGSDGEKHRPVMIHRVVFGSIERFMGILTEQYAGAFPMWLSPVQVKVLSLTERTADKCLEIAEQLREKGFRVETDNRNEKIGMKIREAQLEKVPYMLVIGDRDVEQEVVSVRDRKQGDLGAMKLEAFMEKIKKQVEEKSLD